jgi:hypothetical protein
MPPSQYRVATLAFGLGLAIVMVGNQRETLAAAYEPALVVDEHGCSFSPQINRVLSTLPQHSDMQMHTERRLAGFIFEGLHGVGVVERWDAEWSEVRLYFREDLPALKIALGRLGFRVDGSGHVAGPVAEDGSYLDVEANANDGRYFTDARSYLACGGT